MSAAHDMMTLQREIAALARAQIPLEPGLRRFSVGMPGRLRRQAERVAARLEQGTPLAEALEAEGGNLANVYAAVVEAGTQSGRLPESLESVVEAADRMQELSRNQLLAVLNPLLVVVVTALMLLIWGIWLVPVAVDAAATFRIEGIQVAWLQWIQAHRFELAVGVPLGLLVVVMGAGGITNRIGVLSVRRWGIQTQFAELLLLQVEQGLPLPESFQRAARSTSDRGLRKMADQVAEDMRKGVSFPNAIRQSEGFTPVIRWILSAADATHGLIPALKLMRDSCRAQAERQLRFLRLWLPVFLTLVVSGPIVLAYGVIVFQSVLVFWLGIGQE